MIVYAVGKGKAIHKAPSPAGDNIGGHLSVAQGTGVISHSIAFRDPELGSDSLQEHDSGSSGSGVQEGDVAVKEIV